MQINNIKDGHDYLYFFKIIEKKYIDSIVNKGQIYFGLLSSYRWMEFMSGLKAVGDGQEASLTKKVAEYGHVNGKWFQIHGKESGYNARVEANQCVFSTYAVGLKHYKKLNGNKYVHKIPTDTIQLICKDKGGENECVILIFDYTFVNKILAELKTKSYSFRSGAICYDDFDYIPKNQIRTTEYALECCFHKSSSYQYQNEFRIAAINGSKCSIDNLFVNVAKDDFFVLPIEAKKDFIVETKVFENYHISDKICRLGTESTFYFMDNSNV